MKCFVSKRLLKKERERKLMCFWQACKVSSRTWGHPGLRPAGAVQSMYFSSEHVAGRPGWCQVTYSVSWKWEVILVCSKDHLLLYDSKLFFLRRWPLFLERKIKKLFPDLPTLIRQWILTLYQRFITLFLKLPGDLLKIQLPKYLSTNSYSVELGGVWALVIFEIFPGDANA